MATKEDEAQGASLLSPPQHYLFFREHGLFASTVNMSEQSRVKGHMNSLWWKVFIFVVKLGLFHSLRLSNDSERNKRQISSGNKQAKAVPCSNV